MHRIHRSSEERDLKPTSAATRILPSRGFLKASRDARALEL
jgi:hypothetical protein